jgi:hypothetical protein
MAAGFPATAGLAEGPRAARDRVAAAMEALGPGLSDVVLRVCCFLEGLETTERRLGWSARSGKVVLKIGLQRLLKHYKDTHGFVPALGPERHRPCERCATRLCASKLRGYILSCLDYLGLRSFPGPSGHVREPQKDSAGT